jgi:hypothetical protein
LRTGIRVRPRGPAGSRHICFRFQREAAAHRRQPLSERQLGRVRGARCHFGTRAAVNQGTILWKDKMTTNPLCIPSCQPNQPTLRISSGNSLRGPACLSELSF